jgi:hypothetical protein
MWQGCWRFQPFRGLVPPPTRSGLTRRCRMQKLLDGLGDRCGSTIQLGSVFCRKHVVLAMATRSKLMIAFKIARPTPISAIRRVSNPFSHFSCAIPTCSLVGQFQLLPYIDNGCRESRIGLILITQVLADSGRPASATITFLRFRSSKRKRS